ncbi:MAG: ChaN family lipoprotein [Planctomycetota bacterium]
MTRTLGRGCVLVAARRRVLRGALAGAVYLLMISFGVESASAQDRPTWADPVPLGHVTRAFDTATGAELTLSALPDRLVDCDAVFLGETHTDDTTHRVELAIYEALVERRSGRVVLALEMFDRDAQPALDRYTRGEIDEAEFLRLVPTWSNYATDYRPLIEAARARALPVIGSNLPTSLRRSLAIGGKKAWEELAPETRSNLPAELFPNSDEYWARFERAVRGHAGMMSGGDDPEARLYSIQCLWDNVMGWSCAQALAERPGWCVVHVSGAFHTSHRDGTVAQFKRRSPTSRVTTVDIVASTDLAVAGTRLEPEVADFVVYAHVRATSHSDGFHAVSIARDLEYRLFVPAHRHERLPLLIWLHDDGLDSRLALDYWKLALGDLAVIAVIEAPYPEVDEDLHRGGRWFVRSFPQDVTTLGAGIGRIAHYLSQHFPIDPERLVVAGEGTGATVVASLALHRESTPFRCVAVAPRRYSELRDLSLPDPRRERTRAASATADLRLLVPEPDRAWWDQEAQDYARVAVTIESLPLAEDESPLAQAERVVREELGVPALAPPSAPPEVWTNPHAGTLPRHWAQRLARARRAQGVPVVLLGREPGNEGPAHERDLPAVTRVLGFAYEWPVARSAADATPSPDANTARRFMTPEDFASGQALPMAPGAFGGTTIVVVPAGATTEERARWRQLEADDVLKKRSRFCSLKVAFDDEDRTLAVALSEVEAAGRTHVLIVPARFYAAPDFMRKLRDEQAAPFVERLRISWQPGLGAGLTE